MVEARRPAAAGVFYPAAREELSGLVDGLLASARGAAPAPAAGTARALVVPHGVLGVAGEVAAAGWARAAVLGRPPARIVLLGPAHHVPFEGIAAPFADALSTPLGIVEVDRIAIEHARRLPQLVVSDLPHEQEPSLEVQLPFVQTIFAGVPVVPLIVGDLPDAQAAELVAALWDEATLLVVSTDLSRYFDAATARGLDEQTARAIESLEVASIVEERACGHAALRAMLLVAKARGMRATRVSLRQAPGPAAVGEVAGGADAGDEVTGVGAFVVTQG